MNHESKKYLYFDIPKQERDSAIAYLLEAILKSKIACSKNNSIELNWDEDVNIYLAHLLFAASLPDYQQAIRRYLSVNVSDMAELLEENDDRIVRYFIYKVNADNLLIHLGIFHEVDAAKSAFQKSEKQFASMGQNYYQQAAEYNQRIYRRDTAIGSVLEKLSQHFLWYQRVLHHARKEFFHFSNQFRDTEFVNFCDKLSSYEHKAKVSEAMDRFLDQFALWKGHKDRETYTKLTQIAEELKKLDPAFSFDLDGGENREAA